MFNYSESDINTILLLNSKTIQILFEEELKLNQKENYYNFIHIP